MKKKGFEYSMMIFLLLLFIGYTMEQEVFNVQDFSFPLNGVFNWVSPSGIVEMNGVLDCVYLLWDNNTSNNPPFDVINGPSPSQIITQTSVTLPWNMSASNNVTSPADPWITTTPNLDSLFQISIAAPLEPSDGVAEINVVGGRNNGSAVNITVGTATGGTLVTLNPSDLKFDIITSWPDNFTAEGSNVIIAYNLTVTWNVNWGSAWRHFWYGKNSVNVNNLTDSNGNNNGIQIMADTDAFANFIIPGEMVVINSTDGAAIQDVPFQIFNGPYYATDGGKIGYAVFWVVTPYAQLSLIDPLIEFASSSTLHSWIYYVFIILKNLCI